MKHTKDVISSKTEAGSNTKRIISNSLALFLRMFFVTIINIYSVRFVLHGLGVVDYGIFYAITGIVLMSTFLLPVVSSSLQRFYSFYIGEKDTKMLESLFPVSCNITIAVSGLVFLVLEIVGVWYMHHYLNIPVERADTVEWVFQIATLSFVFSLWLVPFTALIFSHEDMNIYAFLSCLDCLLKFIVALALGYVNYDPLLFYAVGLLCVSVVMFLLYLTISRRIYDECRYHKVTDKSIYKSVLSFSGWTLYGALTGTGLMQGSALILNFFFGPLANAAYAVANNMYNAINSLSNSVVLSFKPAMVKVYAEKNHKELQRLFSLNNKLIMYMLAAVSIPSILSMRTILNLWLGECTDCMVLFCRLFIVYTLCQVMHNPITTIIQSTGDIKKYFLCVETLMLLSLPLAILLFYLGLPSHYLFISIISCCVMAHLIRVACLKEKINSFSPAIYFKEIVIPGAVIVLVSSGLAYIIHQNIHSEYIRLIIEFLFTPAMLVVLVLLFGLSKNERKGIISFVKSKTAMKN